MKIYYLLYAIILFLALRLMSRLIRILPARPRLHSFYLRLFPVFEFAIWIAFGLWAMGEIFGELSFYNIIIIVALGVIFTALGWFFLRDFIAGVVLKTETPFEINQIIKTTSVEGKIIKLGYRSVELETTDGQRVKVPYSQLASSVISLQTLDDRVQVFELTLKVDSNIPIQQAKESIKSSLFLLPWSAINKEPSIRVIDQNNKFNTFQVLFYSVSSRHASFIRQDLKNKFEITEQPID